jgi:hypothetical protein
LGVAAEVDERANDLVHALKELAALGAVRADDLLCSLVGCSS